MNSCLSVCQRVRESLGQSSSQLILGVGQEQWTWPSEPGPSPPLLDFTTHTEKRHSLTSWHFQSLFSCSQTSEWDCLIDFISSTIFVINFKMWKTVIFFLALTQLAASENLLVDLLNKYCIYRLMSRVARHRRRFNYYNQPSVLWNYPKCAVVTIQVQFQSPSIKFKA